MDLKKALDLGVIINLDNEVEMQLVDDLLKKECRDTSTRSIGLRVNPGINTEGKTRDHVLNIFTLLVTVVGGGSISIFNTATKMSKFGLPLLDETRTRILDLYKKYSWLNSIHFHVGSQGNPIQLFVEAAKVSMKYNISIVFKTK